MATTKKQTTAKTEKRAKPKPAADLEMRVLAFRITPTQFKALEAFCKKGETTKTAAVLAGLVKIGALKDVAS